MNLQGRTKLVMWMVLVSVFLLGSITGAALTGLIRSRAGGRGEGHERSANERFAKMRSELNLTDQQAGSIRTILDETRNEYHALKTDQIGRASCRERG